MRPAASSERWREAPPPRPADIAGLHRLDCAGPQEEALAIAHLLRQALEDPGQTAALVTPDRDCARRVAAELRRWGIEIDDSAGVPLDRTPPGIFLRLVLAAACEQLAPVPLLALLKHPLAACGMAPAACRALARTLEIAVLRGPRPAPGVAGLNSVLGEHPEVLDFVASIGAALAPLTAAVAARETTLAALVTAHLASAEAVARTDAEAGAALLWREEAGEIAAHMGNELLAAAPHFPPLDGGDYRALFEALITSPVVRPPYGRHPRLFLWGLNEAQLQRADLLVLGGLNEGVWPPETESDPWLSRPMRRQFGLPPPERRIGIAAHDFVQGLGAREVWLTRAVRAEGAPTVASRWLLRLGALLTASGLADEVEGAVAPLQWARLADAAERVVTSAPAPKPPVSARPRRLTVTEIETWRRDPYAIYARRVLRLKPLEPLDADPGFAERGIFIHNALDDFLKAYPETLPADARDRLLACGRAAFGAALERPGVRAFWWPRFERIADWFLAHEADRRHDIAAVAAEREGELTLTGSAGPFVLAGRADRIDRLRTGGLAIVDYKTGTLPGTSDVVLGYAPQLTLEAAIAEAGGFKGVPPDCVVELAFWHLTGRTPAGDVKQVKDFRQHIDAALAGVRALILRFDDEATPYRAVPSPDHAPRYNDYAHLARIKEWSLTGDREE
jgi:ATP-dependent helicase/nuclease subunit B